MPRYNHRRFQRAQRERRQAGSSGSSARARSIWGAGLVLVLLVVSLGVAVPQAWNRVGLPGLMEEPFKLGLDLQGGTHLVYEANMSEIPVADRDDALQGVRDVIERRVNAFGVSEPVVQTTQSGGTYRVIIELAGVLDVNEAIRLIGETPILEFKEPGADDTALSEDKAAELAAKQTEDRAVADRALLEIQTNGFDGYDPQTIERASEEDVILGPIIQVVKDRGVRAGEVVPLVVETPFGLHVARYDGVSDGVEWKLREAAICFEGKSECADPIPAIEGSLQINKIRDALLDGEAFEDVGNRYAGKPFASFTYGQVGWTAQGTLPPALDLAVSATEVGGISDIVESERGYHVFLKEDERSAPAHALTIATLPLTSAQDLFPHTAGWLNTGLSGKQLKSATIQFDPNTGQPSVGLQFDREGDELFGELTGRLVGEQIGIFLDGEVISAPVVQSAIYGGQAVITGDFTVDEAKLLAQRLNAGALPVSISLLSQQTVGPTLGSISLSRSRNAGLIGFALVGLFMILYYRLAGLLSVFALVLYALLNLSVYKLFGVTLTLAGIAGFILSLGMAVDANVLIFERLKEELRAGRGLSSAIEEGFRRAWTSIRDGNVTTLIAAFILFTFASSFVKGFAVTLSIGVLLSMFSAITITRTFLRFSSDTLKMKAPWLYGGNKRSQDTV